MTAITIDSEGVVGIPTSIALDDENNPHIAYHDFLRKHLKYAYFDGNQWNIEIVDSQGNVGGCWSIAIDASDNLVISYFNWDFGDLKCARKTTNNPPATPPRPIGFKMGKVGWNFTYKASTIDLDGDKLYYMFDWGDGSNTDWLGPYESGEIVKASHAWSKEGTYAVRVKARDTHYSESEWSEPLPVTMPKIFSWNIIGWLLHLLFPFEL